MAPFWRRFKDLWAFGSMPDEKVRELGQAVIATGGVERARELMRKELVVGLDALGPFSQEPGGLQLTSWAGAAVGRGSAREGMTMRRLQLDRCSRLRRRRCCRGFTAMGDSCRGRPWRWTPWGTSIEFWGFKRNQGRVWALLYLRDHPMTAAELLEAELALSKGAVSMLVRDLERWGVVERVRLPGQAAWRYRAETDLMRMVTRVVEEREAGFVARVRADLSEARRLAQGGGAPREQLQRLEKILALAFAFEKALCAHFSRRRS